ncbi:hypothetical protein Scep_026673 [Stephania cephalantha]|uniref:Uncharacterized protein n=1 Tax=Stephania cephalantha TaxID=152367 RepID=A0AAP0HQN1_9MAGN
MGLLMSSLGKGTTPFQILICLNLHFISLISSSPLNFESFVQRWIRFTVRKNSSLPGMHYNAPSSDEIKEFYEVWKNLGETEKKGKFTEFILEKVNLSKLDEYTLLAGLVTPPAAMALKRVGESVPQIKVIKMIPDVIFVPGATLAALVSVKLTRLMSLGKQI